MLTAQKVITKCESLRGGAAKVWEPGISLIIIKGDVGLEVMTGYDCHSSVVTRDGCEDVNIDFVDPIGC